MYAYIYIYIYSVLCVLSYRWCFLARAAAAAWRFSLVRHICMYTYTYIYIYIYIYIVCFACCPIGGAAWRGRQRPPGGSHSCKAYPAIARPLRNIRPSTDLPLLCHTPSNIVHCNVVSRLICAPLIGGASWRGRQRPSGGAHSCGSVARQIGRHGWRRGRGGVRAADDFIGRRDGVGRRCAAGNCEGTWR